MKAGLGFGTREAVPPPPMFRALMVGIFEQVGAGGTNLHLRAHVCKEFHSRLASNSGLLGGDAPADLLGGVPAHLPTRAFCQHCPNRESASQNSS